MKFGGVDPSIIRELSGIYKPFPKAFKELVSNAFDADALEVVIRYDSERRSLSVDDDGTGMTPFEFRRDFTKIGGSDKGRASKATQFGRQRIGCKGIGFLAVARYCSRMIVLTHGPRVHRERFLVEPQKRPIFIGDRLDVKIPKEFLSGRLRITGITATRGSKNLKLGKDVKFDAEKASVIFDPKLIHSKQGAVELNLQIDCRGLELRATLDFEKLLRLAHSCDLYDLDSFCEIEFAKAEAEKGYTKVRLESLSGDVLDELRREQRSGNTKSIELRSGREQFLWHLGRTIPLPYVKSPWVEMGGLLKAQEERKIQYLPKVEVRWNEEQPVLVARQLYPAIESDLEGTAHSVIPVDIDEPGLRIVGYLLATSEVINPPEHRGLTVRVRNVAIGDPHFFGLERTMTGAQRAALQQIAGEIVVLEGLDTPDALNPGRESFYEENTLAKRLRELLAGKPGSPAGLIRRAIRKVLDHSQISSRARTYLAMGLRRRQALLSVAGAINHYSYDGYRNVLKKFFSTPSTKKHALKDAPDFSLRPPTRLHDYSIQQKESLKDDFAIDQDNKHIYFNYGQEVWDQRIHIDGQLFTVQAKRGRPKDPLCEIDVADRVIYVNWLHPLKQQVDDGQYLRQSILWTLAFESGEKDRVMELGLSLLTHQED